MTRVGARIYSGTNEMQRVMIARLLGLPSSLPPDRRTGRRGGGAWPRRDHPGTSAGEFLLLGGQLVGLLAVFVLYRIESPLFLDLVVLCIAGSRSTTGCLPHWRYRFFVGFSVFGYGVLLAPLVAGLVIGTGLDLLRDRAKSTSLVDGWSASASSVACTVGRTTGVPGIPGVFWPILGSLFMFRLIVYLYDVRYAKEPPRLLDFLGYFLLLPNCYFLLFPVVDHATFLVCRDRRPLGEVAQTGIRWIGRGTIQLLAYRFIDAYRPRPGSRPPWSSVIYMVMTYLLYLACRAVPHRDRSDPPLRLRSPRDPSPIPPGLERGRLLAKDQHLLEGLHRGALLSAGLLPPPAVG